MGIFDQDMPSSGYNALRSVIDPNDPEYLKKMGMVGAMEGHHEIEQEKQQGGAMGQIPAPAIGGDAPATAPSMVAGDQTPQLAKPTQAQSNVAGKAEYGRMVDDSTLSPSQRMHVQDQHPWGAPISAHPGILGKIGHGLATAGNIAGDIFAPGTMALIPGTQLNRAEQEQGMQRQENVESEQALKEKSLESEAANRAEMAKTRQQVADTGTANEKNREADEARKTEEGKWNADRADKRLSLAQDTNEWHQQIASGKLDQGAKGLQLRAKQIVEQYQLGAGRLGEEHARTELLGEALQVRRDAQDLQARIAGTKDEAARAKLQQQYDTMTSNHYVQNLLGLAPDADTETKGIPAPAYRSPIQATHTAPAKPAAKGAASAKTTAPADAVATGFSDWKRQNSR